MSPASLPRPPFVSTSPRPLRERTTLELGGAPRFEARVRSVDELSEALRWARAQGLPLYPLGGGSNVLCSDEGLEGVLLTLTDREVVWGKSNERGEVRVTAGAAVVWDELVAESVARGLAGLECLSGIPGWVGAAPIQNIGAYGQSLSDTCEAVEVYDLFDERASWWSAEACAWGYRSSAFKRHVGRFVVLRVRLKLQEGGAPTLAYPQLKAHIEAQLNEEKELSLELVRREVLALRASKSMVYDPTDPNHRSAGSFFLNPLLSPQALRALKARAELLGAPEPPVWPEGVGFKVPAAWLIERAGFPKGSTSEGGEVGLSTKHTLALINRGGASSAALIAFAQEVQRGVEERFGVWLEPEVNLWGFEASATPVPLAPPVASHHLKHPFTSLSAADQRKLKAGGSVALATCGALPPWERDDAPLIAELRARGVRVEQPRWDDPLARWASYDLVIPRTTWDYQERPEAFLAWLDETSRQSWVLNDPRLIRWNLDKRYLRTLSEEVGALTPPSVWLDALKEGGRLPSADELRAWCEERGWSRAFLKPVVAANAMGTLRFNAQDPQGLAEAEEHLAEWLPKVGMIMQPYYEGVEAEGELSMIFFEGELSHGVQKVPVGGDYRVQDDHGATDHPWQPPEAWVEQARSLIAQLPALLGCEPPLYARFDCLRGEGDLPHLIELEMIEPSLFFRHNPRSAPRLAEAVIKRLTKVSSAL